jgi:predicted dehydrogenase
MSRIHRRNFLRQSAGIGLALSASRIQAKNLNEKLNLGFIGTGDRANELLRQFGEHSDARVAALCDPDEARLDATGRKHRGAKKYRDLRQLLSDKNVDAVVIATCNHWHALAAIWACQAGKDIYVEKPLSHNHWEGQQVVRAARKHDRVVQIGTQQRSDPVQAEIKDFLHDKQGLGPIKYVQVCRFGERKPIGRRSMPLKPPASVDYNLWLGPANDEPIYRDKFHYDWHWEWNTGNGEMGNWGVHVLDDAINVVLRDRVPFPLKVAAAGGRVLWKDAGETPNVSFVYYDTGTTPLMYAMSNLPAGPGSEKGLEYKGVQSGYVVYGEGGYYAGGRGGGAAYDNAGNLIRRFKGDSGAKHTRNFVDAVFAHDRSRLNAEVQIGHQSTAWCNLANVAIEAVGKNDALKYRRDSAEAIARGFAPWGALISMMEEHLAKNAVDITSAFSLSPIFEFNAEQEQFVGGGDEQLANQFLRRQYRSEFAVPAIA